MQAHEVSTRLMRLPIRISAMIEPPAYETPALVLTIIGVAALVGFGFYRAFHVLLLGAVAAVAVLAAAGYVYRAYGRLLHRPATVDLPRHTLEILQDRIRCRDLVDGDFDLTNLTPFRWVRDRDPGPRRWYDISEAGTPVSEDQIGKYTIEAAALDDQAETNPYGYYDRAAIQFGLSRYMTVGARRHHADWVVSWLNRLRDNAMAGTISGLQDIPSWLNARHVPDMAP